MPNGMTTKRNKTDCSVPVGWGDFLPPAGIFPVFWISFSLFPFTPPGEYGKLIDETISGGAP